MDRRQKTIIACLAVPSLTVGTDFTGALMLVTSIEHDFGVDITTTQWVLNIYALTFSMGLVAGGRLGDMFGHRRLMLIGLAVFVVASLGCAAAPSIAWLIGARALQGVGSAMLWPCLLGLGALAVDKEEQGYAIGLLIGAVASGNVLGPIVSGVVAGLGEWRWFFYLNLLLGLVSALLVLRFITAERPERTEERIDFAGMIMLSLAVLALLYALDVGADWGWSDWRILALFVAAAVLFALFPALETRVRDPLVPPPMLRNRQFLLALALNGLVVPAFFLLFLYIPQYFHNSLGWSVLASALGALPLMACLSISSVISGQLYGRLGPQRLLLIGYGLTALGALAVLFVSPGDGYWVTLPVMILIGLGGGLAVGPAGTVAVSAADPSRAGLAGGLSFMVHLGLGAIGVAGGTALLYAASSSSLQNAVQKAGINLSAADQAKLSGGSLSDAATQHLLSRFSPEAVAQINTALQEAFTTGLHRAYWLVLALAVLGIVAVLSIDTDKLNQPEG